MYVQTLYTSIAPTQADYATAKSKFAGLKDTNISGTLTGQLQLMLDNIDTLSGPGSSNTLLSKSGVRASDIASRSSDERTQLAEKISNRYMSAIKEAAGDTSGGFADVYGNYIADATIRDGESSTPTGSSVANREPLELDSSAPSGDAAQTADAAGMLVDILMRSVAFQAPVQRGDAMSSGTGDSDDLQQRASRS